MSDDFSSSGLDDIDRSILSLLHTDARISVRALARAVGMSAGAVGERIERLETRGVITGYRAEINYAALGLKLEALIGLELTEHKSVFESMAVLRELDEVVSVELVTGKWDLVARIRVRDHEHLKNVLTESVWKLRSLGHSESMIVLESHTTSAPPT
ncbi:Lrp/AsnC family leucine-responsive transcriptional regulator [Rhodococcus sp. 27YEA15]|uniref:Lrp/AsnC family transcriptional regulator n=1 Tax=Rhodococcus sp. 27YEA15 TaxID=3156259 RepID=UPI003C7B33F9